MQKFIPIDENLITHLEDLSQLTLSSDERQRLTDDLPEILTFMSKSDELDMSDIAERSRPLDSFCEFRDDEVEPSLERETLLQNAPKRNDTAFVAPKTVE